MKINEDIELVKLSGNAYIHVSYSLNPDYGRVGSNGLVFIDGKKAFLFDTPMEVEATRALISFLQHEMKLEIAAFIPNHWHIDCMGGLEYIHSIGIPSYANEMTIELAKQNHLPVPQDGFKDSLVLNQDENPICCYYLGAAHSTDNIVVWIPSEKILFPGCMVKSMNARNLGNTSDGDLNAYCVTLGQLLSKFPDVVTVVPGHGDFGGVGLILHTMDLAEQ